MAKSVGKVKIGVACVVLNGENQILLGKRISPSKPGHGMWQLAGGHHEFGETIAETAAREVFEETNLVLGKLKFVCFSEQVYAKKQYVTFFYIGKGKGKVINNEPKKCVEWKWFDIYALPYPLFEIEGKVLAAIKKAVLNGIRKKNGK